MNPVILSIEKSGPNYWVFATDPADPTKKERTHQSLTSFPDESYKTIFGLHNDMVRAAHENGVELGEDYEDFHLQGMKICQQLEGVMRENARDKFYSLEQKMRLKVLEGIQANHKARRDRDLDAIVALTQKDEAVAGVVARLREAPIKDWKTKIPENNLYTQARRYATMLETSNTPDAEMMAQVPPEARAAFLELARYRDLDEKGAWYADHFGDRESQEELLEAVKNVDGETARRYLTAIRQELDRKEDEFYDYYTSVASTMKELGEGHALYAELLERAQQENIEYWREYLPGQLISVLGMFTEYEIREMAGTAFAMAKQGESPFEHIYQKQEARGRSGN